MSLVPVALSAASAAIIERFNAAASASVGSAWGSDELAPVRKEIKTHYINAQSNRCCYCGVKFLSAHHATWNIDHIVPRSTHPQFLFVPLNLAVTCLECNAAKHDKQILVNRRRKTYPNESSAFKGVHPHFDSYADHIVRMAYVYLPLSDKGKWTIENCDLLRFAQRHIKWDTSLSDRRFEADVESLFDEGRAVEGLRRIVERLDEAKNAT